MSDPLSGLRAWLVQRLSAVYLALFLLYLLGYFLIWPPASHAEWLAWLRHPAVSIAWGVFFVALLLHAWIGARDVILDYARNLALRLALLSFTGLSLLACGLWALRILYSAGR
jgi:succinate dehydrogenase / fumarate reductase membrane anchor subunit